MVFEDLVLRDQARGSPETAPNLWLQASRVQFLDICGLGRWYRLDLSELAPTKQDTRSSYGRYSQHSDSELVPDNYLPMSVKRSTAWTNNT